MISPGIQLPKPVNSEIPLYSIATTLPDQNAGEAGDVITSAQAQTMASALNAAHAHNLAHPVSQSWTTPITVSNSKVNAFRYAIPTISTAHSVVTVYIRASRVGNNGVINVSSTGTGEQLTLSPGVGIATLSGELTVDTTGEYGEIVVTLNANYLGESVTVYSVDVAYKPLNAISPGIARHIDESGTAFPLYPIGDQTLSSKTPLSSFIANVVRENILALRQRRRSLGGWSKAIGVAFGSRDLEAFNRSRIVMIQPGTINAGQSIRIALNVDYSGADDVTCEVVLSGIGSIEESTKLITIKQGDSGWLTFSMGAVESGRIPNPRRPLTTEPFGSLTLEPGNVPAGTILGFSAWCE